jgi:phosphate transport system protein
MATDAADPRSAFRGELCELREVVLRMGALVEGMLARAIRALVTQDLALAEEVRRTDDVADALDLQIEEVCTRLLATQQPLARDLRAITGALRIAADLERIGDYATDIAKVVRRLHAEPYFKPLEDIPQMADRCREMIHLVLRCFVEGDREPALQIGAMDDEIDAMWKSLRAELMDYMTGDTRYVHQAMHLMLVARYLERIGDHTVNVAERILYMQTGTLRKLN